MSGGWVKKGKEMSEVSTVRALGWWGKDRVKSLRAAKLSCYRGKPARLG